MPELNVLGFSCCGLPNCDCGARVVLGARRSDLRQMIALLTQHGFVLHDVPAMKPGELGARADAEPMYPESLHELTTYLKEG